MKLLTMNVAKQFKDESGVVNNYLAMIFSIVGYTLGVAGLFSDHWFVNVIAVLLTAEALVISAYLLHEFSHYSIFKNQQLNQKWGELMTWITGSCYCTYEEIRNKHMHHHVDRADVISFDIRNYIIALPKPIKLLVKGLEFCYIPAAEIMMHFMVIFLPFVVPQWHRKRTRIVKVLLVRVFLIAVMAYISIKAWLLYMLAYCILLQMLRFADTYQHTYDVFVVSDAGNKDNEIADDGKLRDKAYEQEHTYSNLVSINHPWLNLIFLNFPYHNAHHEKPIVPWYELPKLHEKLFGQPKVSAPVIPMLYCLKSYHQHRLARLESDGYGNIEFKDGGADDFVGTVGVSFLTTI
jgi:fatty acid desaturase